MKCLYSPGSNGPECKHCKDNPNKNCQWCNCHICGIKQDPDKQLLCDECDMAYHTYCLNPPLTSIPEDEDWSVISYAKLSAFIKIFRFMNDICDFFKYKVWKLPVRCWLKSKLVIVVAIVSYMTFFKGTCFWPKLACSFYMKSRMSSKYFKAHS